MRNCPMGFTEGMPVSSDKKYLKTYIIKMKGRRKNIMAILEGKKVIIIGDRDGVPGPAIAECVKTAGAEIVFSSTECFV